jgi:hypothetical protein
MQKTFFCMQIVFRHEEGRNTVVSQLRWESTIYRMKTRKSAGAPKGDDLDQIKRVAIAAMFADDELLDQLVLKGGNAMDIVLQVHSRASLDLDFSMADDLDVEQAHRRIDRALRATFERELGYLAFDIHMTKRPGQMAGELAEFWGGYLVDFKLISLERADELARDLERMRKEAIRLGEKTRFTMDISRHEYTLDKEPHELLGYRIFVYSPAMIVSEKIRAICQQMPEYGKVILRNGAGKERARDFVDIEAMINMFKIDLAQEQVRNVVQQMFELKRVPLDLIARIAHVRDFHALGFPSVQATMRPGVQLQAFEHYHLFVVDQCKKLEPLWDV